MWIEYELVFIIINDDEFNKNLSHPLMMMFDYKSHKNSKCIFFLKEIRLLLKTLNWNLKIESYQRINMYPDDSRILDIFISSIGCIIYRYNIQVNICDCISG